MFQTVADTLKLIVKEGMTPQNVDRFLFNLAPFIVMIIAMVVMAPLMFAKGLQIWDVNIGVLFFTAISSVSVIGILALAGWASNNKYSLLGAMRSGAQIVSYELSAGFAILVIVILTGSLRISDIVNAQESGWWISKATCRWDRLRHLHDRRDRGNQPRSFDLAEAEIGTHGRLSYRIFGNEIRAFFLAEYVNILSSVPSALRSSWAVGSPCTSARIQVLIISWTISPSVWFVGKTFFLIFVIMWFQWTFPRLPGLISC